MLFLVYFIFTNYEQHIQNEYQHIQNEHIQNEYIQIQHDFFCFTSMVPKQIVN